MDDKSKRAVTAPSSSGLGHLVLSQKIMGSNPIGVIGVTWSDASDPVYRSIGLAMRSHSPISVITEKKGLRMANGRNFAVQSIRRRPPKLRLRKPSNRAVVTLPGGRDIYLGQYGTPAAQGAYDRTIANWLADGRQSPLKRFTELTTTELCLRFLDHAVVYYRKDGRPTSEVHNFKMEVRRLVDLFGTAPANPGVGRLGDNRVPLVEAPVEPAPNLREGCSRRIGCR